MPTGYENLGKSMHTEYLEMIDLQPRKLWKTESPSQVVPCDNWDLRARAGAPEAFSGASLTTRIDEPLVKSVEVAAFTATTVSVGLHCIR